MAHYLLKRTHFNKIANEKMDFQEAELSGAPKKSEK